METSNSFDRLLAKHNLRYTNYVRNRTETHHALGERGQDIFVHSLSKGLLEDLVVSWLAVREHSDISLVRFAGSRGFDLRCYGNGLTKSSAVPEYRGRSKKRGQTTTEHP